MKHSLVQFENPFRQWSLEMQKDKFDQITQLCPIDRLRPICWIEQNSLSRYFRLGGADLNHSSSERSIH